MLCDSVLLASGYILWVRQSWLFYKNTAGNWYVCRWERHVFLWETREGEKHRTETMFSQLCVLHIYIYIYCIYSAAVHVSVGVCLLERGLGACGREARETNLNSISLVSQLSSDRNVRIWGDELVASAIEEASNTCRRQGDRGATELTPLRNCWCWSTGGYLNGSPWYFMYCWCSTAVISETAPARTSILALKRSQKETW